MTRTMYLSTNPQPVTSLTIRKIDVDGWDFQIGLGDAGYFHLSGQDACDLVFSLATAVHDAGFIDDATARRLSYIGESYDHDAPLPEPEVDLTDEQGEQYEEGR